MSDALAELVSLLSLEQLETHRFRGQSQDLGWGTVFGGQVLGQALSAAAQTVPLDRKVHSLHGYFLRPGAVDRPIAYEVDPIRDGRSFTTRRVVATQNGRAIFNLAASFQGDEPGHEHAEPRPEAQGPRGVPNESQLLERAAQRYPGLSSIAAKKRPIEIRPLAPVNPFNPEPQPPRHQLWMRASGALPDDPRLHRFLLAYASDFQLMVTALRPHGVSWVGPDLKAASLDHAMYFHRDFRMDDWLLYDLHSPWAGGARGLAQGRFYDPDGYLIATTIQEGLMRDRSLTSPAVERP